MLRLRALGRVDAKGPPHVQVSWALVWHGQGGGVGKGRSREADLLGGGCGCGDVAGGC